MKKFGIILMVMVVTGIVFAMEFPDENIRQEAQKEIPGHKNNKLPPPDDKWFVHDATRPQPPVVKPKFKGKIKKAPKDATVLYNGKGMENFKPNAKWKEKDGVITAGGGYLVSKDSYGDIHVHVEWMIKPEDIHRWGQQQGNSGVWMMGHYEIQILNAWGNRVYPDGMAGALYGQMPPLSNPCRKPGEWNSFDIHFKAPKFKSRNEVEEKAYVTVYFNNVLVQDNVPFLGNTAWKRVDKYWKHPEKEPFKIQYHGNPVQFRNMWVAPLKKKLGKKEE